MTSPSGGSGLFQYTPGATTTGDPNAAFPNGNANFNSRSAATGMLPVPMPGDPYQQGQNATVAEHGNGAAQTKNDTIQALLVNSINDPDTTVKLQQQLIQAGYLSPKSRTFVPGSISQDDATFFAVSNLLDDSIRSGMDYNKILQSKIADHPKAAEANYAYYLNKFGADGQGSGLGVSITKNRDTSLSTLSNAGDAQSALTTAMRDHLGRAPTAGEVSAFQAALNSMEKSNPVDRNATIVTDYPGTGGGSGLPAGSYSYPQTYERNAVQQGGVNPGAAAENYVLGNMQGEADSHSINGYVSAFESLLKGGGGNA